MNAIRKAVLVGGAFWLGYYLGRNSKIPGIDVPSSHAETTSRTYDWTALENDVSAAGSKDSGRVSLKQNSTSLACSSSTAPSASDVEDEAPTFAARFTDEGQLVIESKTIAARGNAANLYRERQAFRGAHLKNRSDTDR